MKKLRERVERNIQDRIDQWHLGAGECCELHEYIGWTEEEYKQYVADGTIPEREFLD